MAGEPDRADNVVVLHGIPNCDTVKRARSWLVANQVAYRFHDFKKDGVPADLLANWMAELGWDKLLNRQGTTWRKLGDDIKSSISDAAAAAGLMQAHPSVIKRPVVRWHDGECTVGFDSAAFARRIAA